MTAQLEGIAVPDFFDVIPKADVCAITLGPQDVVDVIAQGAT
jgi:hypothetical protein